MKAESEPISDDEWLLRRVPGDRFRTEKVPLISPNAFEPRNSKARDPDWDGISLYRQACLELPDEILEVLAEDKRKFTGIVKIQAGELRRLGLDIISSPGTIKGHVVIPQLNTRDYFADKEKYTDLKLEIAKLASRPDSIVKSPVFT